LKSGGKTVGEVEIQNLNLITSSPGFVSEISGLSLLCVVTDTDIDTFCSLRKSQIMKCDNPM